jgi:VanZ family protein
MEFMDASIESRKAWYWISILFAVQILGSLIITRLFKMDLGDVLIPICLLILGTLLCLGFSFFTIGRSGSWQWWIPVLIYALFIFSLSQRSYPNAELLFSTKLFHPVGYAVLGILLCMAWLPVLTTKGVLSFSTRVFSAGILLGLSDEFHQALVPGRAPRFLDVICWDLLGLALGFGICLGLRHLCRKI